MGDSWPVRTVEHDLFQVIVIAGQSNAQGWMGDGTQYPKDLADDKISFRWMIPGPNSFFCGASQYGKGWESLGPQNGVCGHGNPALHFGLEVAMARTLAKAGHNLAVIKVTVGGTSLYGDWRQPGDKGITDQMLEEVKKAMVDIQNAGRKAKISGFVWIQGESDADTDQHAANYKDLLTKLISGLRKEWKEPELPVVVGMDEQHPGPAERPQVIEAQKAIAKADPNVEWTSMVGLQKADISHLNNDGLIKHGERIAEAMSRLWKKNNRSFSGQ
ncbi:MAG: sialate O-acetylesterase [bacterium]